MLMRLDNKKKATGKLYYFVAAFLGLILMVIWCSIVQAKPFSDFKYYYELAIQISKGGPWGDTYTTVGYPIILGLIFKICGASVLVGQIFNIILILINYYLVYLILNKFCENEILKRAIYSITIIFPLNIMYSNLLCTEVIFTTVLLLVTNLYFSDFKFKYIVIGILCGINAMIKPFFIIFFFAIFIVDLISYKSVKKAIVNSLLVILLSLVTVSPWVYRNTKLIGGFTFISNNGGIVMYINNNSQNKNGRWMPVDDVENSIAKTKEYKEANMTEKNKMLSKAAKQWIKNNPKRFIELGFLRLKTTYQDAGDTYYTTYGSQLDNNQKFKTYLLATGFKIAMFYPAILFILIYSVYILVYMILKKFEKINKNLLYSTVLFYMFTFVYFITEGQPRYSFPLTFFMIYVTCYFIGTLKTIIRGN